MTEWTETTEIYIDPTMLFGSSFDRDGLELSSLEFLSPCGRFRIWPHLGMDKWSVYREEDGCLWFEQFSSEDDAKSFVERLVNGEQHSC